MQVKYYILALFSILSFNILTAQTVNISGKVLRHNGAPLEGVTVTCTNATSVISAADGSFSFTDLPEGTDYIINGIYDTDPLENVSVLDIAFMQDIVIYNLEEDFPTTQLIAGDLNKLEILR